MTEAEKPGAKRFLVIVQLKDPTIARVQQVVPPLQRALGRMTNEPTETVFISKEIFGYFIRSHLRPGQVFDRITAPSKGFDDNTPPFLDGGDSVAVIEMGKDFTMGPGFTRAATWLQRH